MNQVKIFQWGVKKTVWLLLISMTDKGKKKGKKFDIKREEMQFNYNVHNHNSRSRMLKLCQIKKRLDRNRKRYTPKKL